MYAIADTGYRAIFSPDDALPGEEVVQFLPQELLHAMTIEEARRIRDSLLRDCDWTQIPDNALTVELRQDWADYRQALRDLPEHPDFPDCEWPTPPGA